MSEPKRYDRREIYDVTYQAAGDECLPEPSENGEFVRWEDYARLQAEVERLMQEYSDATNHYNKLHNDLQAEVERLTNRYKAANMEAEEHCRRAMELRKAGDAMQDAVETYFELLPTLVNEVRAKAMLKGRKAIKEWNAAKEGKQS